MGAVDVRRRSVATIREHIRKLGLLQAKIEPNNVRPWEATSVTLDAAERSLLGHELTVHQSRLARELDKALERALAPGEEEG